MCKAEEMWKQAEAFRRQKMTQGEIDSALMEYIGGLEKQRDELLSVLCAVAPHSDRLPLYLDNAINTAIASVKGGAA